MCIRDRAYIEAEFKRKQMEISANSEIEKQRIEVDMRTQISHIEARERREAEYMVKKAKEKEFVTKEMQACMQLERELADEKQKNLKLEYEAKTRRLERELKEKKLPTIKESESGDKEIARTIQGRLRGTLETYTSKIARLVQGRGVFDETASGTHGAPMVLNPMLPEMLPPAPVPTSQPLFPRSTPGMTGPKPIVTAGMVPVAGGVTLLPLPSFRTQTSVPIVEPSPLTQVLVTAKHIAPSVPTSLVAPPKSDLGTPGLYTYLRGLVV